MGMDRHQHRRMDIPRRRHLDSTKPITQQLQQCLHISPLDRTRGPNNDSPLIPDPSAWRRGQALHPNTQIPETSVAQCPHLH